MSITLYGAYLFLFGNFFMHSYLSKYLNKKPLLFVMNIIRGMFGKPVEVVPEIAQLNNNELKKAN